ncbi:uncharacterized protein LOC122142189 [Cyprinus carpio]|uniref:Uncharacterized protein LOC122142189 n=1 Tax=Cyprinus carpio TaxID=7962 RepID=A0A9R0ATD2_CYPCA|nr:uncharacterized protein LOC122142189 [Cyprinus carpio]
MEEIRPNKHNKRISRFKRRITKLRKHHDACARRLSARQKAKVTSSTGPVMPHQVPDDEVPSPLKQDILDLQLICRERSLEDSKANMEISVPSDVTKHLAKQSLSTKKSVDTESDTDTVILELPSSSVSPRACDIPELKRTDSVFLTKKLLNFSSTSDDSISSIDNSEDDYVPESESCSEAKWNSPELLPFTEDVKKMHIHLSNQTELYQEKLKLEKSQKNWSDLAQVTLCNVIVF